MAANRCLLALVVALGLLSVFGVAEANWQVSDSLPSLYNVYASYCDTKYISSWSCGFCGHNSGSKFVGFMEDWLTSTFGFVTIFNNEVQVVFRGYESHFGEDLSHHRSECIMNWVDNLNFWWTPYPPVPKAYVHRGFYDAYKTVASQTRQNVATALKQCPTCKTIRVAGHSLGGALATHAAADLSFVYKATNTSAPGIKLTTFGSPRVGDKTFSTWLSAQLKSSWRMTHYADPVPHLPPTLHEINWHHVPTEIFEGSTSSSYKQCNGSGEDPSCADGILIPLNTRDHLTYMGVSLENGKANRCQDKGPQCNVFLAKYANYDWSKLTNTPEL